jgi:ERCC4-type nuclease
MGLDVESTTLDYADIAFTGRGDDDALVAIGIELKKLPDLMSSLRTGRLSGHQLLGLTGPDKVYDFGWLLVEGEWKPDGKGNVLVPRHRSGFKWSPLPGMPVSEMEKRLTTLDLLGGLRVRHSSSRACTLHFIANLYHWFNDKSMDRHSTHLVPHTAHGFLPLSDFRQTVMRFPNIGLKASKAVEDYFGANLQDAVNASAADWAEIITFDKQGKPRRLGAKAAASIVNFITGGRS